MPKLPDGRSFEYTPEGMAKYRKAVAEMLPTEENRVSGRLAKAGAGAMKGAALGSKYGPVGTVMGAVGGGAAGLMGMDAAAMPKDLPFKARTNGQRKRKAAEDMPLMGRTNMQRKRKAAGLIDGESERELSDEELKELELKNMRLNDLSG